MFIIIFCISLTILLIIFRVLSANYLRTLENERNIKLSDINTAKLSSDGTLETTDEELLAVISAAAYSIINKPVQITNLSFITEGGNAPWKQLGRMSNLTSHNI